MILKVPAILFVGLYYLLLSLDTGDIDSLLLGGGLYPE